MAKVVELKSGDLVYSDYFKCWLEIARVVNDKEWYFEYRDQVLKAQTPLSWFVERKKYKPKLPY